MNEWINKVEKASVRLSIPSFPTLIGRNVTRQGAARDSFDGVIRLFSEIGRLIKTTLWLHTAKYHKEKNLAHAVGCPTFNFKRIRPMAADLGLGSRSAVRSPWPSPHHSHSIHENNTQFRNPTKWQSTFNPHPQIQMYSNKLSP